MVSLAVIADDFTGCTDAEIQLFSYPVNTVSLLPQAPFERFLKDYDVLMIDNEARFAHKNEAYLSTRNLAIRLVNSGVRRIYKKVDSTVRGNIGSEIDAVLDALGGDRCVLVPAYPDNGRTTRNGHHYVNGKLISDTEFANDPVHPVRCSNISELLQSQANRQVGTVFIQAVRSGAVALSDRMRAEWEGEAKILVVDAETNRDLEIIAEALRQLDEFDLIAGSAAMLSAAFEKMNIAGQRPELPAAIDAPTLVVCGSLHPDSAEQIQRLVDERQAQLIELNVRRLCDKDSEREEAARSIDETGTALDRGGLAVITTHTNRLPKQEAAGLTDVLMKRLGAIVYGLTEKHGVRNFYLVGGQTSFAICTTLGLDGVTVLQEIEPGIPVCRNVGGKHDLRLAAKPGGFGSLEALVKGIDLLRGQTS